MNYINISGEVVKTCQTINLVNNIQRIQELENSSLEMEIKNSSLETCFNALDSFCDIIKDLKGFSKCRRVKYITDKIQESIRTENKISIDWEKEKEVLEEVRQSYLHKVTFQERRVKGSQYLIIF